MPKGNVTYLYDPCRCLLLTPHYPLCADDARRWVDCPVERIDADDVCAFRVGVFMPHPDNHMRPWVARQRHIVSQRYTTLPRQRDSLVFARLGKDMHDGMWCRVVEDGGYKQRNE